MPRKSPLRASQEAEPDLFEAFWTAYPKRTPHPNPKQPARLVWDRLIKAGEAPAVIIAGARAYGAAMAKAGTEPQFIAQARTFLGQRRWEEYAETEMAPALPRDWVGVVSEAEYLRWIAPCTITNDGTTARVVASSPFAADWVRTHYEDAILKATGCQSVEVCHAQG